SDIEIGVILNALVHRTATNLIHIALVRITHLIAGLFEPPAQIYLLHMCKEILIKSAHLVPHAGLNTKRCPRSPIDFAIDIILSDILFTYIQYPASAEGVA